jgi:hypothetical protein
MTTITDLIRFLRMLPADAGLINWELTDEGSGAYTLTTTVIFAVPPGARPPAPSRLPVIDVEGP